MQKNADLLFAGIRALGRIVRRISHVLLILAGLFVMFFGVAVSGESFLAMLLYAGLGIAMMIQGCVLDNRLAHRVADESRDSTMHRIAELTRAPWDTDRTLVVGSDILRPMFFVLTLGIIGLGGMYKGLFEDGGDTEKLYFGFLFAAGSVPVFFWVYHSFGKPACVLGTKGIRTTFFGEIPWSHVSGIALKKIAYFWWTPHALVFNVVPRPRPKWNFRWTQEAMSAIGLSVSRDDELVVPFRDKHEAPETVEAVARHLWNQATGKTSIDPPKHPAGK